MPMQTGPKKNPIWFDSTDAEMNVSVHVPDYLLLSNRASARTHFADVEVRFLSSGKYLLLWRRHSCGTDQEGSFIIHGETLAAAFGIHDLSGEDGASEDLLLAYGGTCCAAGQFLRWKHFLVIPSPEGDHVSLEVSAELTDAVRAFIARSPRMVVP
jgi:hypothetical protein